MTPTEEVREAAAKIAENAFIAPEWNSHYRSAANGIAAAIRAMPLPEAPKDEREALTLHIGHSVSCPRGNKCKCIGGQIADAILAAGWRRSPC